MLAIINENMMLSPEFLYLRVVAIGMAAVMLLPTASHATDQSPVTAAQMSNCFAAMKLAGKETELNGIDCEEGASDGATLYRFAQGIDRSITVTQDSQTLIEIDFDAQAEKVQSYLAVYTDSDGKVTMHVYDDKGVDKEFAFSGPGAQAKAEAKVLAQNPHNQPLLNQLHEVQEFLKRPARQTENPSLIR